MHDARGLFAERLAQASGTAVWLDADDAAAIAIDAARHFPDGTIVYTRGVLSMIPRLVPTLEQAGFMCRMADGVAREGRGTAGSVAGDSATEGRGTAGVAMAGFVAGDAAREGRGTAGVDSAGFVAGDVAREGRGTADVDSGRLVDIGRVGTGGVGTGGVVLSTAELAIAETGSVITAEETLGARAAVMLSDVNIIYMPSRALVNSLDDAAAWLCENVAGTSYTSFITGPSRTSDIERRLTIGVQGPRAVTVAFVE